MTDARSVGECPAWDGSIPSSREREFVRRLREVYRDVGESARLANYNARLSSWWHHTLFGPFVPLAYYAGRFRCDDPLAICLGVDVEVGGVPGAPFQQVGRLMSDLEERARLSISQAELRWPDMRPQERANRLALILATLIGRFIQIHPFLNGNGRISRLLWAWGLLRFGVPIQCRIHPRPQPPYGDVMGAAMHGDFGPLALLILRHFAEHEPSRPV
jgi:hypothetical protein